MSKWFVPWCCGVLGILREYISSFEFGKEYLLCCGSLREKGILSTYMGVVKKICVFEQSLFVYLSNFYSVKIQNYVLACSFKLYFFNICEPPSHETSLCPNFVRMFFGNFEKMPLKDVVPWRHA